MGFLTGPAPIIAAPTTGLLGVDHTHTDAHIHREPVPWVFGRARLPIIWLGDAWDQRSVPIRTRAGKRSVTTGYSYYASCAGACCAGPIDALLAVYIDGEQAWAGPLSWSGDFADVTVEGRGQLRIYRGSWSQGLDPLLSASGMTHYPYRGICYIVLNQWYFGDNRTSAPNVELVVRRLPAIQHMSTNPAVGDGANPIHCIADILLDPISGLGVDADRVDWSSFDSAAANCLARGLQVDGSLTAYTKAATAIAQLLQVAGARLIWRNGLLSVDIHAPLEDTDPVIGPGAYTEPPSMAWHGWGDTIGSVTVRFADERAAFQDGELTVALQERRGRAETLDAPWIARQDLAYKLAAARARERGVPWLSGSITVRRDVAEALQPGDGFWLDAPQAGLFVPARATSITIDGPWSATANIEWEEDRAADQPYSPPPDQPIGEPSPEPEPLTNVRLIEAHWGVYQTDEPHLVILAARGDLRTDTILIHQLTSGGYREISSIGEFAYVGTLLADIPESGPATISPGVDIQLAGVDRDLPNPVDEEARQWQAVMLIGDEWFSWSGPTPIGTDQYRIQARRGAYGSPRSSHAAGEKVWLLLLAPGARPPAIRFKRFYPTLSVTLKLQPSSAGHALALADVSPVSIIMTGRASAPPEPAAIFVAGSRSPWWDGSSPVTVSWRWAHWERQVRQDLAPLAVSYTALVSLIVGGQTKKTWMASTDQLTISALDLMIHVGSASAFDIAVQARYGSATSDPAIVTVHKP